jgi:hypothetical protein
MSKKQKSAASIKTPPALCCFPNLAVPEAFEDGPEKYGLDLLFEEGSPLHKQLLKAQKAAIDEKWPDKKTRPKKIELWIRDGNEERYIEGDEDGDEKYSEYKDMLFISAKTTTPPELCDKRHKGSKYTSRLDKKSGEYVYMYHPAGGKATEVDQEDLENFIYSGCMVMVTGLAYAYETKKKKKGVSWILNNVMKVEDGERIGGGGSKADAFEDFEDDFDDDDDDEFDDDLD